MYLEMVQVRWNVRKKVLKTIRDHSLFGNGDTVIAAVSGGADSIALLDILASLEEPRLSLVVAHLNHSLRGDESDGDEAFVREVADAYGLPCEVERADVRGVSGREKLSLEEAGRVTRHAFLRKVAAQHRASVIALGHHADDQAETVLMRLLRGAGAAGLAGMAPKTGDKLVRPLLGVTRGEIEAYLQGRGIAYRIDSSNTDTNFLRNRVRHELLPHLATYNPSIRDRLLVTAEALAEDEAFLEEITDAAFARHGGEGKGGATLCVPGVATEPAGIRFRLYRRAILLAKGDLARIGSRHLRDIDRLVFSARPNGAVLLPDGLRVARSYDALSFSTVERETAFPFEVLVEGPGSYDLGGSSLQLDEVLPPASWSGVCRTVAYFDAEAAPFPWMVRTFRAGDRIIPFGMSGHKKVKDIFIDGKIPAEVRRTLPLLFSGEKLIWVCGMKVSAETRVTELTRTVVRAEIIGSTP